MSTGRVWLICNGLWISHFMGEYCPLSATGAPATVHADRSRMPSPSRSNVTPPARPVGRTGRPSSAIASGSRSRMSQRHADESQRPPWSWHRCSASGRSRSAAAPQLRHAAPRLIHRHRARAAPGARPPLNCVPLGRVRVQRHRRVERRTWPCTMSPHDTPARSARHQALEHAVPALADRQRVRSV